MTSDLFDLSFIPPLRQPRKPRPKARASTYPWKQRYIDAHHAYTNAEFPGGFAASGAKEMIVDVPAVNETNGITRYITKVLGYLGHHAERVNTAGIPMFDSLGRPVLDRKTGKQKYRHTTSTNGSTDIHGHMVVPSQRFPIPIYIEIKKPGERLRDEQDAYKQAVTSTGALHCVVEVGYPEQFWAFYDHVIKL